MIMKVVINKVLNVFLSLFTGIETIFMPMVAVKFSIKSGYTMPKKKVFFDMIGQSC